MATVAKMHAGRQSAGKPEYMYMYDYVRYICEHINNMNIYF